MARLPVVNSDTNNWGTILNTFLSVGHNSDGTTIATFAGLTDVPSAGGTDSFWANISGTNQWYAKSNLVLTGDSRLSDQRTPLDNSVTSAKIVDGAIVDADINASAAISISKFNGYPSDGTQFPAGDGTWKKTGLTQIYDSGYIGIAQASFDVSSISGSYSSLIIVMYARSDRAAANGDDFAMTYNADTTSGHYRCATVSVGPGSTPTFQSQSEQATTSLSSGGFTVFPAANAVANYWGVARFEIPAYASTTNFKEMTYSSFAHFTTNASGSKFYNAGGGEWLSSAAITRVTIAPFGGSNWIAGSRCIIYGAL